jgi:hypothetical protein
LVERTVVGEGERDGVSKGWVTAHPARARRRVRAARVFIAQSGSKFNLLVIWGGGGKGTKRDVRKAAGDGCVFIPGVLADGGGPDIMPNGEVRAVTGSLRRIP